MTFKFENLCSKVRKNILKLQIVNKVKKINDVN